MDRHRQMTIFGCVARERGLAAAARALGVSEATVGRSLAALERRLGTLLFERNTRGVQLTAAGRQFALDCSRLLQAADEADASASGLHSEPRGSLTLVTPLLFGERLLMPVALDFLDAWPGIELSVAYQERFPNLHEEGVDVAVLIGALPDAYMVARRVGQVRQMLCASPSYLRDHPAPVSPDHLINHSMVVCGHDHRGLEEYLQRSGSPRRLALRPGLRCTTQLATLKAALGGLGLVSCLSHEVQEHLRTGCLLPVLGAFEPEPLPVHLVYREGRRASAKVRSFVDFAVNRLREHPLLNIPGADHRS
ncbi:LysR family transcriptional regulator [Pseudomonas sp. GD03842]|uniref:LysR family transcriptional regulator n=1 Tax=unclassified Pseudomonas TaxID=196821 RepID=UPI000D388EB2|nr:MULTISPECIES: LysR family transcriptional regulator [unclassified Pseudomonas]MDH0747224.1 LysR family transcriptional regulator [Pseudomonas sp. GD03842]RAU42256.1 LysR family transcriptional regulator [Pseudomonas sp. RIT 409]RAU55095.1 LysR family transcriptional regulator [Pseudomonas sp. RIT 412]